MKLVLQIAVGVLLAGVIGWMVVDFTSFRHTFVGYSQEEIKQSQEEFDRKVVEITGHPLNETPAQVEARDLSYSLQAIEMMYGKKTADRYRDCHSPKTLTKEQQAWCTKMDKRLGITE
jgi:hypothetical protein